MSTLEADYSDPSYPLTLVVDLLGSGGVSGLACTVAVRLFPTTNAYLDWNDNTFKIAGWGLKNKPMTDIGNGVYQVSLNVQALGFTPLSGLPQKLIAEYTSPAGATAGIDADVVVVSELRPDAKLARQYHTNKAVTTGGAPGQLALYADDGSTVQSTQTLKDYAGGAVSQTPGTPAQRGSA